MSDIAKKYVPKRPKISQNGPKRPKTPTKGPKTSQKDLFVIVGADIQAVFILTDPHCKTLCSQLVIHTEQNTYPSVIKGQTICSWRCLLFVMPYL